MNLIEELIPHRYPFLLVREIESSDKTEIIGYMTYDKEFFDVFRGHFPNNPIVPGVLLIESMAQCGGAGLKQAKLIGDSLLGLASIQKANFLKAVGFGSKVKMVIKNLRVGDKIVKQSGISYVDNQPVIEAEWVRVSMQ